MSEIDKKHSKYIKSAVERTKFYFLNNNNAEGKISTVLRYMAEMFNREEQNNLTEDVPDDICSVFNLFPQGFLSGESLKTVAVSRKITDVEEVYDPIAITEEERLLRKLAISERNKNRFSQKNVEQYVRTLLDGKRSILASEIPVKTKRDLIRVIFISLYGHSTKTGYVVKPINKVIFFEGFRFNDFEIVRGVK